MSARVEMMSSGHWWWTQRQSALGGCTGTMNNRIVVAPSYCTADLDNTGMVLGFDPSFEGCRHWDSMFAEF